MGPRGESQATLSRARQKKRRLRAPLLTRWEGGGDAHARFGRGGGCTWAEKEPHTAVQSGRWCGACRGLDVRGLPGGGGGGGGSFSGSGGGGGKAAAGGNFESQRIPRMRRLIHPQGLASKYSRDASDVMVTLLYSVYCARSQFCHGGHMARNPERTVVERRRRSIGWHNRAASSGMRRAWGVGERARVGRGRRQAKVWQGHEQSGRYDAHTLWQSTQAVRQQHTIDEEPVRARSAPTAGAAFPAWSYSSADEYARARSAAAQERTACSNEKVSARACSLGV